MTTRQRIFLYGLGLLFIAAGVSHFMNPAEFPDVPMWFLYLRLPLQGVLMWWAWVATRVEG